MMNWKECNFLENGKCLLTQAHGKYTVDCAKDKCIFIKNLSKR